MNSKTILIGGVVAAGLITAGVMLGGGPRTEVSEEATGLYVPGFDVNGAQTIEVAYADGGYRLEREGESWGLTAKGGYPVDLGKLRTLLLSVGGAEIVDKKTDDPMLHERLGLEDPPAADDKQWRRLDVTGSNGKALASLVLGKRSGSGRTQQVFTRRSGENQTWLVSFDGLDLPTAAADWIDKQILKIGRDRIRAARVTHADGEVLTVSKADAGDAHYTYHELGDRKLRYVSAPDGLGSALEYLKLEDVARAESMDFGDAQATKVSFWTWDGVRLDVDVYPVDDTHWARLSAVADPDGAPEFDGAEVTDDPDAQASITPESRQADVDALNAKLGAWAFQLPMYNASSLTKRASDYVEAPPKPAPDDEEATDFLAPDANPVTLPQAVPDAPPESIEPAIEDESARDAVIEDDAATKDPERD
ncbi:MAG: DUF4340 domain-containing protein [Planctomycetes bacterium]|nr:DUF4340 domain-containing protein [Planctomycetota bacterium]